jgi:hypothetical protein
MKKLFPYFLAVFLGVICGLLVFKKANFKLNNVLVKNITATALQLGVYTSKTAAQECQNKYNPSIIIKDNDVYRVYYSILTNSKVISKMEDYLNDNQIAFYEKKIKINDEDFINSLDEYENLILEGSNVTLESVNKLIMNSYREKI